MKELIYVFYHLKFDQTNKCGFFVLIAGKWVKNLHCNIHNRNISEYEIWLMYLSAILLIIGVYF